MEWVKLGDVVEIVISGEWGKEVTDSTKISSPVIRTTNFNNDGTIDYKDIVYRDIDLERKRDKLIKKDDILIEKSGGSPNQPVGRVVYFDKGDNIFFNNNFTSILRLKNNYHSKYIFYLFRYLYKIGIVNKFQNKTTGIINLKLKDYLQQTNVLIHKDRAEQELCSETLDLIFELITTRKAQITALDELVQSVFYEMFGDVRTNERKFDLKYWNEVLKINNGKSQKKVENVDGDYPIYGSGGIMSYADDWLTKENSVIIGRKGNINTPLLVKEKFWHVDTAFGLEPKEDILNVHYLYGFCQEFNFETLNKAVTIPSLTKKDLLEIQIPLPPIELQEQFAAKVEATEAQKARLQTSLEEMETLFDALMQEAFSGNLG